MYMYVLQYIHPWGLTKSRQTEEWARRLQCTDQASLLDFRSPDAWHNLPYWFTPQMSPCL